MAETPFLRFDNEYAVPPAYALAWLTDFREDDMQRVGGPKQPLIKVTRIPDGRLQREFDLPMGMGRMRTVTTVETDRWVAVMEQWNKKGKLVMRGHIVESVRPGGAGTLHRVEITGEPLTFGARMMGALSKGAQASGIRKLFQVQKRDMEAAFASGKPPTS
jgi:hypothetical protein